MQLSNNYKLFYSIFLYFLFLRTYLRKFLRYLRKIIWNICNIYI